MSQLWKKAISTFTRGLPTGEFNHKYRTVSTSFFIRSAEKAESEVPVSPEKSSTASFTVPLPTNDDEENNSIIGRLNDGLQLPAVKTPLKRGLKKTLPITPEASTSTGGSSVPLRWHPSPAKRWKHATEVATKPLSPVKTLDNQIQELREVIQHGPAELVGCTKYQYFRTSLTVFFLIHKLRAK